MPPIRGNDRLTINGVPINYQGLAHLKATPAEAAEKTKENGLDEMIITFVGADGKAERVLVWGDNLNFDFRRQDTSPRVRLNDVEGMLVHFQDEKNSVAERTMRGIQGGSRDSMESIIVAAKKAVEGVAYVGAAGVVGGTIVIGIFRTAAIDAIRAGAGVVLPFVGRFVGTAALLGAAAILAGWLVKAVFGGRSDTKMETIAAVIDDDPTIGHVHTNQPTPAPAPPAPPATETPTPPAGNAPGTETTGERKFPAIRVRPRTN